MVDFTIDLTGHEITRRAAVMAAIDHDPIKTLAEEEEARRMLYSNLDEQQQRIYNDLVAAGVLDEIAS